MRVPVDPALWSDDDALSVLTVLGGDGSGHRVIGEPALQRWLASLADPPVVAAAAVPDEWAAHARRAMAGGEGGSFAAGEFPKFTALREGDDGQPVHVRVKFSGSDDSPQTRRWADLLVCEALASEVVGTLEGLQGARSRVLQADGRTFLEVARFDRHGLAGRSGLCSWAALNGEAVGLAGRPWVEGMLALRGLGLVDDATVAAVDRIECFGQLIDNTDMHDGNLSFVPGSPGGAPLALAPVYDMLPMAWRPIAGVELAEVEVTPVLPLPRQREAWLDAASAAVAFWSRGAADARLSDGFRAACATQGERVERARARVLTS